MIITAMRALTRPFKASEISLRIGNSYNSQDSQQRAIALLYIERQTAQKRLDEVCSEFSYSWSSEKEVVLAEPQRVVIKTTLTLKSATGEEIHVRAEYGEASGDATKSELFKSASSDSFKRASSEFGIGRYLYSTPNVWFDLENRYRFQNSDDFIVSTLYRKMGLEEFIDFPEFIAEAAAGAEPRRERAATERNERTDEPTLGSTKSNFASEAEAGESYAKSSSKPKADRPAESESEKGHRDAVPATEKQVNLITKLLGLKNLYESDREAYEVKLQKGLSKKEASAIIDELQGK